MPWPLPTPALALGMLWLAGSAAPVPGLFGFRLLNAGEAEVGTSWTSDPRTPYRTGHHSVQWVLAGAARLEIDGAAVEVGPGAMAVVPAHRWLRRRGGPGLRLRWVGFAVEPVRHDLDLGACPRAVLAGPQEQPALAAGLPAADRLLHGQASPLLAAQTTAALATACALLAAAGAPAAAAATPLERARAFLDRHYGECPALAAVARAAGRSPQHLHQAFRAAFGCTPAAYAERLRMRDACLLLADPDLPVAEAARRCGYADPFHFSRVVRRTCGLSPRTLRRRLRLG